MLPVLVSKVSEDLGDGLKAIYQLEVQADLNGNSNTGFNGTRNSNVGLNGNFGTAFMGIWDTPYKVSHNKLELFDNTTFASAINVLGRMGNGVVTTVAAPAPADINFNNRLKNSVQYWTPSFNGFQAKLAYGTDNVSTATVAPAVGTNQTVISLSADYDDEMFYAAYGYETFKDTTASTNKAGAGNKADGSRLVGAYKFAPESLIGVTYERLSTTTGVTTATRTAWELMGKYTMGTSTFGASYVKAGNNGTLVAGAVVPSGATQISLRYGYNFSKRSEAYAMYTALSNDVNANYNLSGGTAVTGSVAGAKLTGLGFGMVHKF